MMKFFLIIFLIFFLLVFFYIFILILENQRNFNKFNFIEINGYKLKVEIANNFLKRTKGLSNRLNIKEDEGMLFIFEKPAVQNFWMKNMNFPIDIIWIKNNKVIGFVENALPEKNKLDYELKIYQSPQEVDKVLELKQGSVKKFNIKIGDKIKIY